MAKDGSNRGGVRKGAGRPPGSKNKAPFGDRAALASLARTHTEDAIGVLYGVMMDEKAPETARISAANHILDRGYGRVAQQIMPPADEDAVGFASEAAAVRSSRLLAGLISQIEGAVAQDYYKALAAPLSDADGETAQVIDGEFAKVEPVVIEAGDTVSLESQATSEAEKWSDDPMPGETPTDAKGADIDDKGADLIKDDPASDALEDETAENSQTENDGLGGKPAF